MEIKIRIAEEKDFQRILELIHELAVFEHQTDQLLNSAERMKAEKEYFNCYVAETNDGKIVGYATYIFCYYTWVGKSLYMDDLYVQPDYRGMGIGTMLIRKVMDYARETKCHRLRWQVSNWNEKAIVFYTSLGAVINETEQNCDVSF
jgi:ribosomal protein S18 acetylase RimI-like enzyme